LEDARFKTNDKNPLTELSELRFNIAQRDKEFNLSCRLMFGKMSYEFKGREYEIGVSRAFLRLTLEGCETTLDKRFGENVLAPMSEENCIETEVCAGTEASVGTSMTSGINVGANASGQAYHTQKRTVNQNVQHLPVTACPNSSWEVKPLSVSSNGKSLIEGTAIPNKRLCSLQRKQGGNRIVVIGEVQISKSDIKVSARGGNMNFKAFNTFRNKDAIIGLILKRAIQREAANSINDRSDSTAAISRCEVIEE